MICRIRTIGKYKGNGEKDKLGTGMLTEGIIGIWTRERKGVFGNDSVYNQ